MKLVSMRYKTMKDEIKTNGYNLHIPTEVIKKSGIDINKELKIEVENKKLIVTEK